MPLNVYRSYSFWPECLFLFFFWQMFSGSKLRFECGCIAAWNCHFLILVCVIFTLLVRMLLMENGWIFLCLHLWPNLETAAEKVDWWEIKAMREKEWVISCGLFLLFSLFIPMNCFCHRVKCPWERIGKQKTENMGNRILSVWLRKNLGNWFPIDSITLIPIVGKNRY